MCVKINFKKLKDKSNNNNVQCNTLYSLLYTILSNYSLIRSHSLLICFCLLLKRWEEKNTGRYILNVLFVFLWFILELTLFH